MGKRLVFACIFVAILAIAYYFVREKSFDASSLRDKVVLITGTSTGIGEQLAYQYAKLGAMLVLTARREKVLAQVAQKCRDLGSPRVEIVPGDMSEPKHREEVIELTKKLYGRLDYLVLNHVLAYPGFWQGSSENMTQLELLFEINFLAYVDLASRALDMLTRSKGSIGVLSSVAGNVGIPTMAPYSASKFALQGFFSSLRQELLFKDKDVSITICVLGLIATDNAIAYIKEKSPGMDASNAVPADDTALEILKSIALRETVMYYPKLAYVAVKVHKFFPEFIESLMCKEVCGIEG